MDLGIAGRRAIVCAASKGLGRACAMALAAEGVALVINARGREALEATASEIREIDRRRDRGRRPTSPRGGRAAVLAACPTPTSWSTTPAARRQATSAMGRARTGSRRCDANMLTPIELMRAVVDGMVERGFGRIVNITSAAVKAPIAELGLSNGARAGPDRLRRRPGAAVAGKA